MERKFKKKSIDEREFGEMWGTQNLYNEGDRVVVPNKVNTDTGMPYRGKIQFVTRDSEGKEEALDIIFDRDDLNYGENRSYVADLSKEKVYPEDMFDSSIGLGSSSDDDDLEKMYRESKIKRKFVKKSAPFGTPPPPTPGMPSKPPVSPPTGQGAPTPSPTPPKPPQGLTEPPGAPDDGLKPRTPGAPIGDVPTDVTIDAATGHVTIKKGPVNIRVADISQGNPYDKFRQGETCPECNGFGVYKGGDCHTCGGRGVIEQVGDTDPWNYTHAPRETFLSTERYAKYSKENPPSKISHLPTHAQHIWVEAFNNAFDEYDGDESRAHATAWSAVQKAGYKTKKKDSKLATHENYIKFKANDKEPQYGDWKDETEYSKDTHDNPFANPKNRLKPPTFTVTATIPDYMNPRSIAYALETQTMLDIDVDGKTVTINKVSNPISLIAELAEYGIEAKTDTNMTKFDQGMKDFVPGQKVALLGDFADMNYYYDSRMPAAQAYVITKTANGYILENDQWGRFEAREDEISAV